LSLTWLLMGCPAAAAPQEVPGSALDAVLDRGVLRVCSSGDYRPFTYSASGATYEGADIEMAASLGQSLNVRVAFVQTAWKDLVANVKAGKCDIGMGGISVSLERARETAYSLPYLKDGKTAIARCESASGYTDLAAIDQAGVRVIVNPGGTIRACFVRSLPARHFCSARRPICCRAEIRSGSSTSINGCICSSRTATSMLSPSAGSIDRLKSYGSRLTRSQSTLLQIPGSAWSFRQVRATGA
jgi:hypothetical protein